MINNAFVHLILGNLILYNGVVFLPMNQVVTYLLIKPEIIETSFIKEQLAVCYSIYGANDPIEEHYWLQCDIVEESPAFSINY